jgi:hypothetical protein
VFVAYIREMLGVSVEKAVFLVFSDDFSPL